MSERIHANPKDIEKPSPRGKIASSFRWLRRATWFCVRIVVLFLIVAWATLALYFSNLPWPLGRLILAIAFALFAITAIWIMRQAKWRWWFAGAFACVVVWFILIPPSNDRPWRGEVLLPARAEINGNQVRIINFRNFVFRSREDFDVRYEEREVDIARINSIDLLISYWKIGPIAHTFLSFNFDDGTPPVCISIETRPEIGEGFDPLASMFKQFELIYIVGDERDIVRVRTDYRDEDVYLYRIRASPELAREMFRTYLDRINSLAERPEWYHLLKNNCTINIIRYSQSVGGRHARFDIRHFLNGLIDAYLFHMGFLDTSLEFDELRRRSHINAAANAAGNADDFSVQIRKGLPGIDDAETVTSGGN